MKKNVLAVCDTESGYACNFAEYMNRKKRLPFEAEAFTDVEKLREYAGEEPPEIYMVAEADMDSRIEELAAGRLIILSEEKEKREEGKHKCIYKYQSVEGIVKEVMEYCAMTQSFPAAFPVNSGKITLIGVYSPIGRCGKTLFALTAGQILAQKKQVLYINMEDYSGFSSMLGRGYERNLGDLFYAVRTENSSPLWKLESMIKQAGKLDYIPPAESPEDMREIKLQEWVQLLETIQEGGKYETVILDIGNGADQLFQILDLCKRVYMPVLEDKISEYKLCQFKEQRKLWNQGEEKRNIRELPFTGIACQADFENFPEALVQGKWGSYVRRVLREDEGII